MTRFLVLSFAFLFCLSLYSQEVAQWRGDNRDGIYNETGLLKEWPEDGPELLLHIEDLGDGHASAAVTADMIYTAGMFGEIGYVMAFDHDGNQLWKSEYGKEWSESYPGSRTTPLIDGDKLYIQSGFGEVVCMNSKTGEKLWSVDMMKEYGARNISWGFTENMAFLGDMLYCTPGGDKVNVIALDKNSGKLIWKSGGNGEKSAYGSPQIVHLQDIDLLVAMTNSSIVGFDAKKGKFLWRQSQINEWSVHPNTPLYHDGQLYGVSGYGKGGVMVKLSDDGKEITKLWSDDNLDNRMGGVVLVNGKIYGSGDVNRKWFALDWKTGEVKYSATLVGKGNVIFADGLLYCYGENGKVMLVEPGESEFKTLGSFRVPYGSAQHWAHLVIHDKKLYLRHGDSMMVYNIAE